MILEIVIFLVTTVLVYYLYSYKRMHGFFKERGINFLPGVPVFGNMMDSTRLKRHFIEELEDVYSAYPDDKYVGFFELTTPAILIRDPELIKNIVVKDFDHFTDHRDFFGDIPEPILMESLLFMKGEKWRTMRTTLSPAFTGSKMKQMLPFMQDISKNIVNYLNDNQNQIIDVDDLIRRYTNDVIASAGFGLQVNSLKDRENEFYMIGSNIFKFNLKQRIIFMLLPQFPILGKKFNMRIFPEKTCRFFSNIVSSTMEYRKKEKVERPDMIQLLMETERSWTADELAGQVFIFFTAGFETSATALSMTIHELALNQDVQEKLYQECRRLKEEKELTFDSLNEHKYLDAVLNETLRIWSPALIMDRTCTKTYELPPPRNGGKPCVVKRGDVVYNAVNQLHLDAKYWPDPYKYDPERFSEENKSKIKPFTFMPFGVGPRSCIGMRFAILEVKVLLYYLVLNFKILKTEKTMDPIKLLPHSFTIKAKGGTFVQFEKRV